MHRGGVHAEHQCIEGGVHAARAAFMRRGRRLCGCGLDPARAPDAEVAVQRSTEEVGDEHVYIDVSAAGQERIIESIIYHLYPYTHISYTL